MSDINGILEVLASEEWYLVDDPDVGYDDDDLVAEQFACPTCGERRLDYLVFISDDDVLCNTCDTEYRFVGKKMEVVIISSRAMPGITCKDDAEERTVELALPPY